MSEAQEIRRTQHRLAVVIEIAFAALVIGLLGLMVVLVLQQSGATHDAAHAANKSANATRTLARSIERNNQSNDVATCRGQQRAGIDAANLKIAAATTAEGELRTEFGLAQAATLGTHLDLAPWLIRAKKVEDDGKSALAALDAANDIYKAGVDLAARSTGAFLVKCRTDGYLK